MHSHILAMACRVLPNNTVVCEQPIYESYNSWKQQKNSLDNMIQQYREQLDRLKVKQFHEIRIRRFLKGAKNSSSPMKGRATLINGVNTNCGVHHLNILLSLAESLVKGCEFSYFYHACMHLYIKYK